MMTSSQDSNLFDWVNDVRTLTQPDRVVYCNGSEREYQDLLDQLMENGTLRPLNHTLRPGSYWAHSDPRDVARVENRTYVCSEDSLDAGPTNNWRAPAEMKAVMTELYEGSMRGRTMYVIPFSMGPLHSRFSLSGVQLTDSPYVVISMRIMTRMGSEVLEEIEKSGDFVACIHSVGFPLPPMVKDVPWPCDPENIYVSHFPETREIWSYGSGYGGNALLGKKCLALRIASVVARDEGWLAEHMMIVKVTNAKGRSHYIAGAFPSACGKTNLAMMVPAIDGLKVETIGDDICWMRLGEDGRLYAINPEAGFFGVAPGTSLATNPNAMATISKNTIFTNTALDGNGDTWWEGMTDSPPDSLTDWQGRPWDRSCGSPASHPNARFTVPATQAPQLCKEWEDPNGVPISAILFGGRRGALIPLVSEARSWEHGVFLGSVLASETTAAAEGETGKLRRDPFAMVPFCGYDMGRYFEHWLGIGKRSISEKLPRMYLVNWFRRGSDQNFLWPGYGENARVLEWIVRRIEGEASGVDTPLGIVPGADGISLEGLEVSPEVERELFETDAFALSVEARSIAEHFSSFGDTIPAELLSQLEELSRRISSL